MVLLTDEDVLDGLSLASVLPGPTAINVVAYTGSRLRGMAGAAAATIGMFAPSSALLVLCTQMLTGAKNSLGTQAVLRGGRAATTGTVFTTVILIGKSASPHWISIALFTVSLIALWRYRINVMLIIPLAGATGIFLY